jgi:hypothetical protein
MLEMDGAPSVATSSNVTSSVSSLLNTQLCALVSSANNPVPHSANSLPGTEPSVSSLRNLRYKGVYDGAIMRLVEEQLSKKENLRSIAGKLKVEVEQLNQHLERCITQDSARGWEINLDMLMEVPPFTVQEESVDVVNHLWYQSENVCKEVPFAVSLARVFGDKKVSSIISEPQKQMLLYLKNNHFIKKKDLLKAMERWYPTGNNTKKRNKRATKFF